MINRILIIAVATLLASDGWFWIKQNYYKQKIKSLQTQNEALKKQSATLKLERDAATISATAQGQIIQIEQNNQEVANEENITDSDGNFSVDFDRMWQ